MQLRFRNNPDITNSFRNMDVTTALTTLGFLAGAIDLALHSHVMGHPRYGLEFMGTLATGSIAAYRYAQQTLQNILQETNPIKADNNL